MSVRPYIHPMHVCGGAGAYLQQVASPSQGIKIVSLFFSTSDMSVWFFYFKDIIFAHIYQRSNTFFWLMVVSAKLLLLSVDYINLQKITLAKKNCHLYKKKILRTHQWLEFLYEWLHSCQTTFFHWYILRKEIWELHFIWAKNDIVSLQRCVVCYRKKIEKDLHWIKMK